MFKFKGLATEFLQLWLILFLFGFEKLHANIPTPVAVALHLKEQSLNSLHAAQEPPQAYLHCCCMLGFHRQEKQCTIR